MNSHIEITSAQRMRLIGAAGILKSLENWQPVGEMLESIKMALYDCEGLTNAEEKRIVLWAARWGATDMRLRRLYEAQITLGMGEPCYAVRTALWGIMTATELRERGVYGALSRLWADAYGYPPPIEMVPKLYNKKEKQ